jgi:hypothetical protein
VNENKIALYKECIRQIEINLKYEKLKLIAIKQSITAMKKSILNYRSKIKDLND